MQLLFFFIFTILALCKSVPTVSASSIITETNDFKEGKFTHFWRKAAKKVNMLTVYSRD
jgi:hypothetical protein